MVYTCRWPSLSTQLATLCKGNRKESSSLISIYYQYILHTICLAPSTYNLYLNLIIQYNSTTIEYKKPLEVVYIKVPKWFNTKNYLPTFTIGIPVYTCKFYIFACKSTSLSGPWRAYIVLISNVFNCYCHNYTLLYTSIQILLYSYQLSCWEGIEDQGWS